MVLKHKNGVGRKSGTVLLMNIKEEND